MSKSGVLFLSGELTKDAINEAQVTLACDATAYTVLKQGVSLDLAIGDFDSVTEAQFSFILSRAKQTLSLPVDKDDTDAQAAVIWFFTHYPDGYLTIFGAFGGRLDHFLANIFLPSHPQIAPFMRQIVLRDINHYVTYYPKGQHEIAPCRNMTGLAFIQENTETIEIYGAKFELTPDNHFYRKVYSSNAFAEGTVTLVVKEGYAICLQTREREKGR